jgi:hypothetical protein
MLTMTAQSSNGATETSNLQFGAEVVILKKDLEAVVEHGDALRMLIAPVALTQPDQDVTLSELVDFAAAIYSSVSKTSPLDADKIKAAIGAIIDPDKFSIDLSMLFLYMLRYGATPPTGKTNELEYAFKLAVKYDTMNPDIKNVFDFKSLYMAIWNTNRAKIVDKMQLKSVDALLAEFDKA